MSSSNGPLSDIAQAIAAERTLLQKAQIYSNIIKSTVKTITPNNQKTHQRHDDSDREVIIAPIQTEAPRKNKPADPPHPCDDIM